LRKFFPLLIFVSFAWSNSPLFLRNNGGEAFRDSLKAFKQNFVPGFAMSDQVIHHKGYTLCYDEGSEQAKWVAYRLTAEMCDNNGEERTDNFRTDKAVKTGSASPNDYKKSGYDRGHLCPAGDMGWNAETMSESFLMSNMSPQVPGFNRGIWKNLETDVRRWAKTNGELYVVTAGVLKDSLKCIGNNVAVPEYYFKVLLDLQEPEFKAIAFVLPNRSSKLSVFKYAVSIDSVERLTGLDFFPLLPDSLESQLEMGGDVSKWKLGNDLEN
jgi:endonuclease G